MNCAACGTELRPGARFCDHCGQAVGDASEPAPAGQVDQRKRITVLFADLAGSTAMQETLDPEVVRRIMGRWSSAMRSAIEQHGGLIDTFAGDGVLATWGVEGVREDDALRALTAAWAMRTSIAALNEELDRRFALRLRMRIGVHTGDVVVSSEGFLIGDTMNTAARLEQNAPPGEILVGRITYQLVREHAELEPVEPIAAKGKSNPVPAWRVASMEAPEPGPTVPFVGRESELAHLTAALDDAIAARACRMTCVIGSPGLGKSRLAGEFVAGLAGRARVVTASCPAYGEGMTYAPVVELVRGVAQIGDEDDVHARLQDAIGAADPAAARVAAGLAGILGAGPQTPAEEIFWAVRTLLERVAADAPLVVLLEDLHWGQPQFLDLVEHLAARLDGAPVLLLALARPELRGMRGTLARGALELGELDEDESRRLVGGMLGGGELGQAALQIAAGNPLFLGELVRMRADNGSPFELGEPAVPPTISALIAARLQQLPVDERAVVDRAAVVGREFSRGAIVELAPGTVAPHVDRELESLRRKEVVDAEGAYWLDEPVYAFHHALIRETAYESLLKETRATLHERYAAWLDARAPEVLGETEELVAFHLEQAYLYRRAVRDDEEAVRRLGDVAADRLASAGRRALARDDFAAAGTLLGRALATASRPLSLVRLDRCTALLGAGDFEAARTEVTGLERLAGDDPVAAPAAVVASVATDYLDRGAGRADVARLDRAIAALRTAGPEGVRVLAHALNWKGTFTVLYEGRHSEGQAMLEEALECARVAGDERLQADVLTLLALVALWGPLPLAEAEDRCELILARLREHPGSRKTGAQTQCVLGLLAAMRGRVRDARDLLGRARHTFADLGLMLDVVDCDLFAARAELLNGDPDAAESHARAALAGPGGLGPSAQSVLAQARAAQGDAEALVLADQVLSTIEPSNLRPYVAAAGVRVRGLSSAARHSEATEAARAVVAVAGKTDAAVQRAEALELLADTLRAAGDPEAGAAQRAALDAFVAKGHTAGADRVRAR